MGAFAKNAALLAATKAKNDEFYTQLSDIERECRNYKEHFRGKTILCNCDDPRASNFFRYFYMLFNGLGLKRVIAACYKKINPDLFSQDLDEQAVYCIYDGAGNDFDAFIKRNEWGVLQGDGDFRSSECIEFLKQADIVVTNPPFSLFREYLAQLIEYDKKFLIIGNKNAIGYKETFKLIRENKLWIGHTPMGVDMLFDVPEYFAKKAASEKKEGSSYKIVDGVIKGRSTSVWFTNLDHKKRHETLRLWKKYTPEEFPKYDNYDAINVNKTDEIPADYDGVMGVPISFMDKYNPEQFEIVGNSRYHDGQDFPEDINFIRGKGLYWRILIKRKRDA